MHRSNEFTDDQDTMQSVLTGLGEDPGLDLTQALPHHTTPVQELPADDLPTRQRTERQL